MPALLVEAARLVVPPEGDGPLEHTVAWNFERFDGLGQLENGPGAGGVPVEATGVHYSGENPRPGQLGQPSGQEYTPGPLTGLTNTLGGQPLPVEDWRYRQQSYTPANTPQTMQHRLGQGQAYQGVAQTVALGEITNTPPAPDSLESILRGWA
jgi:hypothetical protein